MNRDARIIELKAQLASALGALREIVGDGHWRRVVGTIGSVSDSFAAAEAILADPANAALTKRIAALEAEHRQAMALIGCDISGHDAVNEHELWRAAVAAVEESK